MAMRSRKSSWPLLLLLCSSFSRCGIVVTHPSAGAVLDTGHTTIQWTDDGRKPSTSELSNHTFDLCADGGNTEMLNCSSVQIVQEPPFSGVTSTSVLLPSGTSLTGESDGSEHFFRIQAWDASESLHEFYSGRFWIVDGTAPKHRTVVERDDSGDIPLYASPDMTSVLNEHGPYVVPYTLQTGVTRYAPMQRQPGSKITASRSPKPLWPTSSVSLATTWLPPARQSETHTQTGTYSINSQENEASALPLPESNDDLNGDMRRFMDRWKD